MPDKNTSNKDLSPQPEITKNSQDDFKLPEDQMSPESKILQGKQDLEQSVFNSPTNQMPTTNPPEGEYITQELKNTPATSNLPPSKMNLPKVPKFNFPKKIIFAALSLILLTIIVLVAFKLRSDSVGPLVGTKGEITWWGVTLDSEVINPLIRQFEEQNPSIRIKYIKQSPIDYRERLTNAIASGAGPDMFEIHNSWTPMYKDNLSSKPDSIMSNEEYSRTFYPVVTESLSAKKGIVGMPLQYDALTLFINEDIFTSAALKPPTTWNDLRKIALKLTQKDDDDLILQSGVGIGTVENLDYWQEIIALMMIQNGVNLSSPAGIKAQDALYFFVQFNTEDEVWDDTMPPSTHAFASNKLAMYFAPASAASDIRDINPNLRFRTVPLPQLAKENPQDPDVSYASFWVQAVWNRSSNAQSAWELLKFLSSPESLQKMNSIRKSKNIFERAYPRPDMSILQVDDNILGSIVSMGNYSHAWYLVSGTNDGETGINSQLARVFKDAINKSRERGDKFAQAVEILAGVKDILAKYGIK